MTMHIRKGLVIGLLLALGAAGCGGADGGDGVATAGGGGDGGTSASPTPGPMSDEERQVKFAQCMRDQGVDMPDPEIDNGRVRVQMPGGTDPQKAQAAMEKCKQYLPNGGERRKPDAQQLDQLRKFAQCMRENGIPEFPDPNPDGGVQIQASPGSHMNPDDPTFKAAEEACAKYRPTPPSGETPRTDRGPA
jgi:hypothetical protein